MVGAEVVAPGAEKPPATNGAVVGAAVDGRVVVGVPVVVLGVEATAETVCCTAAALLATPALVVGALVVWVSAPVAGVFAG